MSYTKRPNTWYADKYLIGTQTNAAIAATTTLPVCTMDGDYRIDKFEIEAPGGYAVDPANYYVVSLQTRPQAITVVPSTGIYTAVAHGLDQSQTVYVSTSVALPTGLVANTPYYVIVLTANTFKLATSVANVASNTALTVSDAGTGVQTATIVLGVYSLLTGANGALNSLVFAPATLLAIPCGLRGDQLNVVLTKVATAANFPAGAQFTVHCKQLSAS